VVREVGGGRVWSGRAYVEINMFYIGSATLAPYRRPYCNIP